MVKLVSLEKYNLSLFLENTVNYIYLILYIIIHMKNKVLFEITDS